MSKDAGHDWYFSDFRVRSKNLVLFLTGHHCVSLTLSFLNPPSVLHHTVYPPHKQPLTRPVRVSFEPVCHSPVIIQFIVVFIWHG